MFFLKKNGYLSTNCDGAFTGFCERVYAIFVSYRTRFLSFLTMAVFIPPRSVSTCLNMIPCVDAVSIEIGHFHSWHTSSHFWPSVRYRTQFLDLFAQGRFHPFTVDFHSHVGAVSNHFHQNQFRCGYPSFLTPTRPLGYINEGRDT